MRVAYNIILSDEYLPNITNVKLNALEIIYFFRCVMRFCVESILHNGI